MFLKFMLSKDVRPYRGIDISNMRTEEEWEGGRLGRWKRWERKIMGLTDSPYHAYQTVKWAKELAIVNI